MSAIWQDIHIKTLIKVNILNKSIILNCEYGKGWSVLEVINEFKKFTKNQRIKLKLISKKEEKEI